MAHEEEYIEKIYVLGERMINVAGRLRKGGAETIEDTADLYAAISVLLDVAARELQWFKMEKGLRT